MCKTNNTCPNNYHNKGDILVRVTILPFSVISDSSMFDSTGRTKSRDIHSRGWNPLTHFQEAI